jgi:hypothetical protein
MAYPKSRVAVSRKLGGPSKLRQSEFSRSRILSRAARLMSRSHQAGDQPAKTEIENGCCP